MQKIICTVIVVTYNGKRWYDKCFQSLLSSSIPLNIIVIDNKSTDDSVSYITNRFPKIKVIQSKENLGFARANNIGLKIAYNNNNDYYFLLNQDAWVEYDTIETLINVAKKEQDFGLLNPIHLTSDKTFFEPCFRNYFHSRSETISAYENLYLKKQEPVLYESTFVNAAAWLITRKCIETVGGFDTILFKHYGEDNNYCQRVLFHKLKIGIVPSVTICHDTTYRVNSPMSVLDDCIFFSVKWGNILLPTKKYFIYLVKYFIKAIFGKGTKKYFKEVFWVINNIKNITKSRKVNKIAGKGLEYIEDSNNINNVVILHEGHHATET